MYHSFNLSFTKIRKNNANEQYSFCGFFRKTFVRATSCDFFVCSPVSSLSVLLSFILPLRLFFLSYSFFLSSHLLFFFLSSHLLFFHSFFFHIFFFSSFFLSFFTSSFFSKVLKSKLRRAAIYNVLIINDKTNLLLLVSRSCLWDLST